jgi:hypothetical protein
VVEDQLGAGDGGAAGGRDGQAGRGQGVAGAGAEQGRGLGADRRADGHVVAEHEPGQPLGQRLGRGRLGVEQDAVVQHGQTEGELDLPLGRQQQRLGGVARCQVEGVLAADGVEVGQHVVPGEGHRRQVGTVDDAGQRGHEPMVAIVVCGPVSRVANWAYTRREVVQLSEPVRTREVTAR